MTKKVIIIDDSSTSLNIAKTAFASVGWEVFSTKSAADAIEMIYDIAPDIIVTDAIMPIMGGFQLLKAIRKDPKLAPIPAIVYSVLDEKNAKFYIKEERLEYYIQKSEDVSLLVSKAAVLCEKHPVSQEQKFDILKSSLASNLPLAQEPSLSSSEPEQALDYDKLAHQFKEKYDFLLSDETLMGEIFSILYPILEYDLSVIALEGAQKTAYFDIRNILLSPIFQNKVLSSLKAKSSILFKKYAPNLNMIVNEDEFLTKLEFNFEHKEKPTAQVIFYFKQKSKWSNRDEDMEIIKKLLDDFFSARYMTKSAKSSRNSELNNRYLIDKFDYKFDNKQGAKIYASIIEIANFKEIQANFAPDEVDILNSKITEKIIGILIEGEQVYKNDEGEYDIVIYARDDEHAKQKLSCLADFLEEIELEDINIEIQIGASSYDISHHSSFREAQKQARLALDRTNRTDKVIIYGSK